MQINTTITRRNLHQIDDTAELLSKQGIVMWSVFFLIPVGRGIDEERITPEQYEEAFEKLWNQAGKQPFGIKTTEAPHYRRFVLERDGDPLARPNITPSFAAATRGGRPQSPAASHGAPNHGPPKHGDITARSHSHRAPLGVRDGNGIMFVGHMGEIFPAGFLPVVCGKFPEDSVVDAYQKHPTFVALRDPDQFADDCGVCEYRYVCGGSRSRAYAVTGNPLGGEPDCVYQPGQRNVIEVGAT